MIDKPTEYRAEIICPDVTRPLEFSAYGIWNALDLLKGITPYRALVQVCREKDLLFLGFTDAAAERFVSDVDRVLYVTTDNQCYESLAPAYWEDGTDLDEYVRLENMFAFEEQDEAEEENDT